MPCSSPAYLAVCAVNGGNYVMLPTPGSIAMFEGWSAAAPDGIKENQHDQQFLDRIWDKIFRRCTALWGCNNMRNEVRMHSVCARMARNTSHGWGPAAHMCNPHVQQHPQRGTH